MKMRVFAAVPVPGSVGEQLQRWAEEVRGKTAFRRWVHPLDYHITLQFLGEVDEPKLDELRAALKTVHAVPFSLRLHGAGFFGPPKAPRVLWAAVAGQKDELVSLHGKVLQATQPLGFVPEDRPYAPHITLARNGESGAAFDRAALSTAPSGAQWTADRFVLMRTHMHASPMYEKLEEYIFV